MRSNIACLAVAVATVITSYSQVTTAAARGGKRDGESTAGQTLVAPSDSCEGLLIANESRLSNLDATFEEYPIDAILTSDPEQNLAVKHPSIVMDVSQVYWHAIRHYPARKIFDPTYPVIRHDFYPIFSEGVNEADGAMIIGQYEAIRRFVEFVRSRAAGQGLGNMMMLVGPAGTGKTEFLVILDRVVANLSLYNPDYFQYTYEFRDLHQIPALRRAVDKETGQLLVHHLPRSPLTLLDRAPRLRDAVVGLAAPRVREAIGFEPSPFTQMDPQTSEIIDQIVAHYRREWNLKEVSEADYIKMLRQHVRVVRRIMDPTQPPALIRYQGKHPDPSQLFAAENPLLKFVYGNQSALSYDYSGLIMRSDGRGALFDEFFRQEEGLRNSLLDFAQNGIVEANGAPAVRLNTIPVLATNDENVTEAREEAGSKAALNRLMKEPMRQPIHPTLASATALWMAADRRVGRMFSMQKLGTNDVVPASMAELFPAPNERGTLLTPEDRYAVYYTPAPGVRILIAPHALQMLGLTVAGTRLVTDVKQLEKHANEFDDIVNNIGTFEDPKTRLAIITRQISPQAVVYSDLHRVMYLLHEGERGISARDAQRWLLKALNMAIAQGRDAVTPTMIDRALDEMMVKGEFDDAKNDVYARWRNINSMVKVDFVLPALTADIQKILGGDSGVVAKVYTDIKEEIIALNSNPSEEYWFDESNERHAINRQRLEDIRRIYQDVNKEPFNLARVKTFITNARGGEPFQPLMRAVESYLLEKELSTSAMSELLDYLDGKPVSEDTRMRGSQAEQSLERFGYNKRSFREALNFVKDQQYELKKRQGRL